LVLLRSGLLVTRVENDDWNLPVLGVALEELVSGIERKKLLPEELAFIVSRDTCPYVSNHGPRLDVVSGFAFKLWNHDGCVGCPAFEATRETVSPSSWYINGDVRLIPLFAPV
jgi:hypothetical protein